VSDNGRVPLHPLDAPIGVRRQTWAALMLTLTGLALALEAVRRRAEGDPETYATCEQAMGKALESGKLFADELAKDLRQ
jgi:hypothetical protein